MWTLIIYIFAGVWAKGDSVALTQVNGFTSQQVCEAAAQKTSTLPAISTKEFRYVCVEVK